MSAHPPSRPKVRLISERWPLAALEPAEWMQIAVAAAIAAGLFALFHFLGNTVADAGGRSAFLWMFARWQDKISFGGADYSHGYVIPFVSLWALWYKRHDLMAARRAVARGGLALIALGLAMHWVGAKMQQTRVSLMALILLLWALPYYFYGWDFARHLLFPVGYLIFCIPMNFLDVIAFPLRMFATTASVAILRGLGVDVTQTGSAIRALTPLGTERWGVDIANPCSGLRSLLAMTALTAAYAFATQRTLWKKLVLFSASIPLAIAGNIVRIVVIGLIAESFGEKVAVGLIHEYSGYVVFIVAIALMVTFGSALNSDPAAWWRGLRERWFGTATAPTAS
ncbi:MAG: exosortase/archaeosortase family protein [Kiritimatiellae bacterium]|nr:exosortase/archaeosortase family protein [Kiritimatiellia bacterium]